MTVWTLKKKPSLKAAVFAAPTVALTVGGAWTAGGGGGEEEGGSGHAPQGVRLSRARPAGPARVWGPCVWGRGPPSAAPSQEEGARGAGGQLLWGHLVGPVQDHRRARPARPWGRDWSCW